MGGDSPDPIENQQRRGREGPERELDRIHQPDEYEQYVDFFKNAGVPMHWVGPDGSVLNANQAELDALGYSREEYVGHHIEEFHADQDVIDDILDRLSAGEELQDYEARMERKDGSIRHVLINSSVNWKDDEFVNTRCVTRDITDRKEREQELRHREESLQAVYEIISKGEGSISEQIDALLAVARNHIGTDFASFSHIDGDQYEFEAVDVAPGIDLEAGELTALGDLPVCERAFQTGQTLVISNISAEAPELSDPEWGVECYIGTPVNVDENPYGTFCFYDVKPKAGGFSDWERTFIELLGDWVGSAIHRQETRERLQRQNERLEAFTSIVSHDLRNPLNVAEGNLVLAREAHDSEQLQAIERAHERMSTLIEDLLTVARGGDAPREYESVELGPLVKKSWGLVETADATIQIEFEGAIQADRSGLEQLVENLIRNAVEHGGDDVTVTVGGLPDGFYVEDNGPGIPPDERENVLDAGYSTQADGTGLGLHIVHDIAETHGWTISVAESSDGGARFEFSAVETA